MKLFSIFTLLLIVPSIVLSQGQADQFTVSFVRVDKSGRGYVDFSEALKGSPPSCATRYPRSLAFDTREPGGKAILSVALLAKASGMKIYAMGTGDCVSYGVMENWSWGYVK